MSSGAPLNLSEPATGTTNWGTTINANFTAINTAIAALQAGGSTGPAGPPGEAGAVGMIFTGPWSSLVSYIATDAVTFNGSTYIATAPSVGAEPDTHPSAWAVLALAGAAGPAGPTGPEGPAGPAGSVIALPVPIVNGGTGATTAPGARSNLGAAASGANSDITSLTGIPGMSFASILGPTISVGSGANVLTISGQGITCNNGQATFDNVIVNGGDLLLATGSIISSASAGGGPITLGIDPARGTAACVVVINDGLIIEGSAPSCSSGQIGFGATTASTATAGGGQAVPATVLGYLLVNNQGTIGKIPIFAV